jgi:hypothetical protein
LHAQIEVNAWRHAETTANELAPHIGTVGSDRPLARLGATIELVDKRRRREARRLRLAIEPVKEAMRGTAVRRGVQVSTR